MQRLLYEKQLRLQRMEIRLVEALFQHPGTVDRRTEHELRYALSFAQLGTFQPGAAAQGRRNHRPDVELRDVELTRFRNLVLEHFSPLLLSRRSARDRLEKTVSALGRIRRALHEARSAVIRNHANEFSAQELDLEVGKKTLVSVAGGGGGAGYVYVGAWDVLQQAGLTPGYVLGSSIGAVLGLFRCLRKQADWDDYMAFAKHLKFEEVLRVMSFRARYGLPGIFRLFLHGAIGSVFKLDRRNMRLNDLEIPFECVVGGIRRGALGETPDEYGRSHHLPEDQKLSPFALRAQIASQLVRMVGFFNPILVREIVIGGDALTREFDCVDAAGFSAAVPGVLHYDVTRDDARMHGILGQLLAREDVVALIDGGVANNVPANTAFRRVQEGVVGTRNCFYLCFDSLRPQTRISHLWFSPLAQIVALQVALHQRYMHRHIRFKPTLSVINVLPNVSQMAQAVLWGREQMAEELPFVQKFFEPVIFMGGAV
ncbi:MAG: patatin-like phospholipase family protein [Myxococcales bacterium]